MRRVTLKDVAQKSGFSITAVSLVLNNRPCNLKEKSKEKIRETARLLNYSPNQIARSLVTQESRMLGLIIPNIKDRFFSLLAQSLEERCRQDGYALVIASSNDQSDEDSALLRMLINRGVDGMFIVVADEMHQSDELLSILSAENSVPFVMVSRAYKDFKCDKVGFDDELGGYLATKYLLEKGHKEIGLIVNTKTSYSGQKRYRGYIKAMVEHRFPIQREYVVESTGSSLNGYFSMKKLLGTGVTAIFVAGDNMAIGVLKCLNEQHMSVPSDYSLVSYGNIYADLLFKPTLTSVDEDIERLSDEAFLTLMKRRAEPQGDPQDIVLVPKLSIGKSVTSFAKKNVFRLL